MSKQERNASEKTNYLDYMQIDQLLSLQHPLSLKAKEPVHDEHLFVIMHQSKELWFLQLIKDLEKTREELCADRFDEASMYLVRCRRIVDVLLTSWEVLATLRPREFWRFRKHFGDASGMQSMQFRHIEFLLGHRYHVSDIRTVLNDQNEVREKPNPDFFKLLDLELVRPSLWDEVLRALSRRYPFRIPPQLLERDWSKPYNLFVAPTNPPDAGETDPQDEAGYKADPQVELAWLTIYSDRARFPAAYRLGEALLDLASILALWRQKHILTVQRFIGDLPGTGKTSGVPYLAKTLKWRVFPELWSIQNRFSELESLERACEARARGEGDRL